MNKNILIMMPSLYSGGAEKQYRYIIKSLKQKYRLIVLLLGKSATGYEQKEREFVTENKECVFLYVYNRVINNKKNIYEKIDKFIGIFKTKRLLKKLLHEYKIDYSMFSYVSQLILVDYLTRKGIKCVFNERNTGRQICDRWFKINCLKKCYKVISNSKYASNYIKSKTNIDVEVYNNGIEIDKIEKIEHNSINIIVPARITRIKNQMILLKALEHIELNNYKVFFIGGGDEEYILSLEEYIVNKRLNNKVEIVGFTDNIKEYYAIADIVVLPSFEEGTPNILLESYLYRILPLCSNIEMNQNCVVDRKIMFSPTDEIELAKKINIFSKILKSDEVKRILDRNYEYVTQNYSIDKMKEKYLSLFK